MLLELTSGDLICKSCELPLRSRSQNFLPGLPFQSFGRSVTPLRTHRDGRHEPLVIDQALCFNCSPRQRSDSGLAADSWRLYPPVEQAASPKRKPAKKKRARRG